MRDTVESGVQEDTRPIFQFKELEIKPEGSWLMRLLQSVRFRRTLLFTLGGAALGYGLFWLMEGQSTGLLWSDEALEHLLMGAGMGFLITNSPCARGRCNT